MTRYEQTKIYILDKLESGIPKTYYYHSVGHVLDVLAAAEMIGEREKVSGKEMELLRVAVLFHDSGFMVNPKNHEQIGCDLAKENLPRFGYSEKEIETICGMILATCYPQKPNNLLEEIICDADLDYLGRDDFFSIGNNLMKEMNLNGSIKDEKDWNKLQESFLSSHHYFTLTSNELRSEKKKAHLEKIREMNKRV
ncbi:MAG TPA: HD domain-containing protein [Bacteroidia bacterium]|nr:HD domain-containing protein [Bacteroidia bacterium]